MSRLQELLLKTKANFRQNLGLQHCIYCGTASQCIELFFFHLEEQRALEINLGGERLENNPVILFSEEVLRVENRNHTTTF